MDALVIGAGPAGLMAAEELALAGRRVVVCEAKPSAGRKFLMAGKSGLNVTKDEGAPAFLAAYGDGWLSPMLRDFGPEAVKDWCRALGQEVFTGSSGRVFPVTMKGSPLLRAWLGRLGAAGVELRLRWRWTGFEGDGWRFDTPAGLKAIATYADGIGVEKAMVISRTMLGNLDGPTQLVADAHAAGLDVHVWTFRRENYFLPLGQKSGINPAAHGDLVAEIKAFLDAGIDGFFSDNVAEAVEAAR